MAETTNIEWTDRTYNPWIGCTKVSPGCVHCYAETFALQKKWLAQWGPGDRLVTQTALEPVKWNEQALAEGTRCTVFCASLSDVFEKHVQLPPLREDLWRLIKQTPFLDWMILTKRAENIAEMLPPDWGDGYANVCLMVSVENQKYFNERVPLLRKVPARYRALSVEPMIGAVKMPKPDLKGINLVILGGESGTKTRPMNPAWVRSVRDDCKNASVLFFFKQWGNWTPDRKFANDDLSNAAVFENGTDTPRLLGESDPGERKKIVSQKGVHVVYEAPSKKNTGSLLDGIEHKKHIFLYSKRATGDVEAIPALTPADKRSLVELEAVVSRGFGAFWQAGQALRQIRDRGLYRETHKTFEAYCLEKWEISRSEAYRQIGAANVVEVIEAGNFKALPLTVSQTGPLLTLKSAHRVREAWAKVEKNKPEEITAKIVETAVAEVLQSNRLGRGGAKVKDTTAIALEAKKPERDRLAAMVKGLRKELGKKITRQVDTLLKRLSDAIAELKV